MTYSSPGQNIYCTPLENSLTIQGVVFQNTSKVSSHSLMPAASECCDKCCNQWLPQCRIARESDSLSPAIYFCVENLKRPISHRALWFEAKILMLLPYQLPSLIGDTFFSPRPTFQSPSSTAHWQNIAEICQEKESEM